jgi:hypothetical protein
MLREPYDERSDVFSFALIMWEVRVRRAALACPSQRGQICMNGVVPLADLNPEQAAAEMVPTALFFRLSLR